MLWELAHRRRDQEIANRVEVDAGTSHQAIEDVRVKIPADEVVLYVRQLG